MTYIEPTELTRPFKRGDRVQVMNGDHSICGANHRVVYAGKKVVRIEDGRRYRATDGWWIGANGTWPFPWLRLAPENGAVAPAPPESNVEVSHSRREKP